MNSSEPLPAGWSPAGSGNAPAAVRKNLDSVLAQDYDNIRGIVVVKHGRIAYEHYARGCGADTTHHLASVTKSILSALFGIALQSGYIRSVEQPVLEFFPEYKPGVSNLQREKVTLHNLLSMTVPYPFDDWREPLDQLCSAPDWTAYTLERMGQGGEIGDFKYSTAGAHLLSAVLTRCTGKPARELANEWLFAPLGIPGIPDYPMAGYGFEDLFGDRLKGWVHDPQGNSTGGWGLCLTVRDMARFGCLYLNHGRWGDQQIVPADWIDRSLTHNPNRYGYLWWLFENEDQGAYAAVGDGGNIICCVPQEDLVVAIGSAFSTEPCNRFALIQETIIPAMH